MSTKPKDLNFCECGELPTIEKGPLFGKEEIAWVAFCNNPRCKCRPSTGGGQISTHSREGLE